MECGRNARPAACGRRRRTALSSQLCGRSLADAHGKRSPAHSARRTRCGDRLPSRPSALPYSSFENSPARRAGHMAGGGQGRTSHGLELSAPDAHRCGTFPGEPQAAAPAGNHRLRYDGDSAAHDSLAGSRYGEAPFCRVAGLAPRLSGEQPEHAPRNAGRNGPGHLSSGHARGLGLAGERRRLMFPDPEPGRCRLHSGHRAGLPFFRTES